MVDVCGKAILLHVMNSKVRFENWQKGKNTK